MDLSEKKLNLYLILSRLSQDMDLIKLMQHAMQLLHIEQLT